MLYLTQSPAATLKKSLLKNYIYHENLDLRRQVFLSWVLSGCGSSLAQISWVTKRRTQLAGDSAEELIQTLWLQQSLWMCPDGNAHIQPPGFKAAVLPYTPWGFEKLFLIGRADENTTKKPKSAQNFHPLRLWKCPTNGSTPPRSSFGQLENHLEQRFIFISAPTPLIWPRVLMESDWSVPRKKYET